MLFSGRPYVYDKRLLEFSISPYVLFDRCIQLLKEDAFCGSCQVDNIAIRDAIRYLFRFWRIYRKHSETMLRPKSRFAVRFLHLKCSDMSLEDLVDEIVKNDYDVALH